MDFNLPEELQMLKDTVRKFVDKELIPIEMHTLENMELKPDIRERLEKKTREMGLWMFLKSMAAADSAASLRFWFGRSSRGL